MAPRRTAAFTLLEVLIALGVFVIAVVGMMMALDAVLTAAREARFHDIVRHRLENHLALLEGGVLKETERKVDLASPPMTITESVHREEVLGEQRSILQGFWRVKVIAEWESQGVKQKEEASILRFGP